MAERFADSVGLVQEALAPLGVMHELLGELPGEYCPGHFSLHLPSGFKVARVAQRVIRRTSLTTAVVVIRGGDELRDTIAMCTTRLSYHSTSRRPEPYPFNSRISQSNP